MSDSVMDSMCATPDTPYTPTTPGTPSRRLRGQHRERMKLFSQISLLATTVDNKVETILQIDDCPQVDDSSLILLSLPNGWSVQTVAPIDHSFHSFCITSQTGQRIYGGSYVFSHSNVVHTDPHTDPHTDTTLPAGVVYTTRALVALTVRPLVDQLRRCLQWCVCRADCNPRWIRCVSQIRLPPKGKCIQIVLPNITKNLSHKRSQHNPNIDSKGESEDTGDNGVVNDNSVVTILRPLSTLPLFDYPFRLLFSEVLSVDHFLLCYCCALIETQILVMSSDYYKLMLVAECLSTLLNPFKWQHVYVPILPTKLGVHYLDAPTPYIMGVNKSSNIPPADQLMVGCLIDCDEHSVELNLDASVVMPPFMDSLRMELETILNADLRLSCVAPGVGTHTKSAALQRLTELAKKHNVISDDFTYLDDLKLNQQIRVLFLKTIRKHILHKYQQFIIYNRKDSILFDTVSYLSDRPQSMQAFLQQFVSTQMFVTFIDEMGKQLIRKHKTIASNTCGEQSLYESIYDDDFEDLDLSLFTDQILESRFQSAKQIALQELEELPTLDSNTSIVLTTDASHLSTTAIASPRTRRRFQTLSQKSTNLVNSSSLPMASPSKTMPAALTAQTNWRVVETLMKEVKMKTKRILLEKMGNDEVRPLGCGAVGGVEENTLIAALCDLIERIWSHATSEDNKEVTKWQSGRCSFWSHLMAYYQLETNDAIDGNTHKNIESSQLTPGLAWILFKKRIDSLSQISIDSSPQSTPSSPSKSQKMRQINSNSPLKSLPTTLLYDVRSVRSMVDIKTDVGKCRAFIRLALERKLLSKHLRTLLSNQELLLTLYKRYAFLRCEEEREQFLTHLLTLNAVDLMCFTNTFTTSLLPYTLIIYGSSQMNGWFSISGSMENTCDNLLINCTNCYTFKHRNLGVLNTLTIGCNQGTKIFIEYCFIRNEVTNHIYKFQCNRWFGRNIEEGSTERVLIGELLTGSVSEILKKSGHPTRSSSIGRNWTRSITNDQYDNKETTFCAQELQTLLGENVNQIMKYYYNAQNASAGSTGNTSNTGNAINSQQLIDMNQTDHSTRSPHKKILPKMVTKSSMNSQTLGKRYATTHRTVNTSGTTKCLTQLIFGERKLLWILTQIFYFGFKNRSRSSFRKQSYLWDYMLRVCCELKISRTTHKTVDTIEETLIDTIDSITDKAVNYGKDQKFALFLLLSIRDHQLIPGFLQVLCRPSLTHLFYESHSFTRDATLVTFLHQILNTFNDISLSFESSLTKAL